MNSFDSKGIGIRDTDSTLTRLEWGVTAMIPREIRAYANLVYGYSAGIGFSSGGSSSRFQFVGNADFLNYTTRMSYRPLGHTSYAKEVKINEAFVSVSSLLRIKFQIFKRQTFLQGGLCLSFPLYANVEQNEVNRLNGETTLTRFSYKPDLLLLMPEISVGSKFVSFSGVDLYGQLIGRLDMNTVRSTESDVSKSNLSFKLLFIKN